MPFVTFNSTTRRITGVYEAQDGGNTRTEVTAYEVAVGWYLNTDGTATRNEKLSAATIAYQADVRETHRWLDAQLRQAIDLTGSYPSKNIDFIKDEIFHVHEFIYAVCHDARYSVAQRRAMVVAFRQGTAGGTVSGNTVPPIPDVVALLNILPALPSGYGVDTPIVAPFGWVNPSDAVRWNALQARSNSAGLNLTAPSPGTLNNGMWIDSLRA